MYYSLLIRYRRMRKTKSQEPGTRGPGNKIKDWSYPKLFVLITAGLILLTVLLLLSLFSLERNVTKDRKIELAGSLTRNLSAEIVDKLDIYTDLLFITANSVLAIMQTHPEDSELIDTIFSGILAENPHFVQVRYIDSKGRELYRVDRIQGSIIPITGSGLQDKSGRYYFKDAVAQGPGSLYISPLDLNVEYGRVQVPWVPTLRMATAVQDPASAGLGIVIINIDMSGVLSIFQSNSDRERCYLLNSEGYYLAGAAAYDLWGFMFGRSATFEQHNPGLWSRIRDREEGSFVRSKKLYTFTTVDFRPALGKNYIMDALLTHSWKIVVVSDMTFRFLLSGFPGTITIVLSLALILLISRYWSKSIVEKREALLSAEAAKAALIKSEKMASLGRLVAGIAHELNTPIGSSVTIASTLQDELSKFSSEIGAGQIRKSRIDGFISTATTATETMLKSLERAATLVSHFKQVSVDQSSENRRRFRVPEYINDILDTLRPTFKHRDISIDVGSQQSIELDSYPGAFAQVLSNIINNAVFHAFPGDSTGTITIRIRKQKNSAFISIRDNGIGIPEENLERIFDPFFTTAAEIGGSGLGLHIVYNIVNDLLGGHLYIHSKSEEYTEFIIELPLTFPG